jgi:hypothetical protein
VYSYSLQVGDTFQWTEVRQYAPSRSVCRARYDAIHDVMVAVDNEMTSVTKVMGRITTMNVPDVR